MIKTFFFAFEDLKCKVFFFHLQGFTCASKAQEVKRISKERIFKVWSIFVLKVFLVQSIFLSFSRLYILLILLIYFPSFCQRAHHSIEISLSLAVNTPAPVSTLPGFNPRLCRIYFVSKLYTKRKLQLRATCGGFLGTHHSSTCIPPLMHRRSHASLISCIADLMHPTSNASLISCIADLMHPSSHVAHISCSPHLMHRRSHVSHAFHISCLLSYYFCFIPLTTLGIWKSAGRRPAQTTSFWAWPLSESCFYFTAHYLGVHFISHQPSIL